MFSLLRAVLDRLKTLLVTSAALELEADAPARHAQRKAESLRRAAPYEAEKLPVVAQELRQHAEALDLQRPLASVVHASAFGQGPEASPVLPAPADATPAALAAPAGGRREMR